MDDKELYYDLAKFKASIMAARSNFMLVFQTILFTVIVAMSSESFQTDIPQLPVYILGLGSAIIWLYLNYLNTCQEEKIFEKLYEVDPRIKELMDTVYNKNIFTKIGRISHLMTYPLPILVITLWSVLLWINICN